MEIAVKVLSSFRPCVGSGPIAMQARLLQIIAPLIGIVPIPIKGRLL